MLQPRYSSAMVVWLQFQCCLPLLPSLLCLYTCSLFAWYGSLQNFLQVVMNFRAVAAHIQDTLEEVPQYTLGYLKFHQRLGKQPIHLLVDLLPAGI